MIKSCRICSSRDLKEVFNLGQHPLADTFIRSDDYKFIETYTPLTLVMCNSCNAVQTGHSISQTSRYQDYDYSYDSMNSPVSTSHFAELANSILSFKKTDAKNLSILEFGSNIGTLLLNFKQMGVKNVLGVDPAKNIAEIAIKKYDIPTLVCFYDKKILDRDIGQFDIITGSNVVNHADNINEVFKTSYQLLKNDGTFVFEVPYLLNLIENNAFDTIYHEHVHYHSITTLKLVAENHGFAISKVEFKDYMCGTIRVYCQKVSKHCDEVLQYKEIEKKAGIFEEDKYSALMQFVLNMKYSTMEEINQLKLKGEKICGIGAATKGNTLLNFFGLDSTYLDCISDTSSFKEGKLTPGSRIPIVSDKFIIDQKYAYGLILPWNISSFLENKLSHTKINFINPNR